MLIEELVSKECGIGYISMSAKQLTTLKSGGDINIFLPKNVDETINLLDCCNCHNIPVFILGGGSNTVVSDSGAKGKIVISTKYLSRINVDKNIISAECGVRHSSLIKTAREYGLGGLEYMAGVPCTVGGMAHINAGAFATKTSDYICKLHILTADYGKYTIKTIQRNDVDFGYRKGVKDIVYSVEFELDEMSKELSIKREKEYLELRREKQPKQRSVGSVFKNDILPAGKLIESVGLKGKIRGGMMISPIHANFIVNVDNGTTCDFLSLVSECEKRVYEKFNIKLDREFVLLE